MRPEAPFGRAGTEVTTELVGRVEPDVVLLLAAVTAPVDVGAATGALPDETPAVGTAVLTWPRPWPKTVLVGAPWIGCGAKATLAGVEALVRTRTTSVYDSMLGFSTELARTVSER